MLPKLFAEVHASHGQKIEGPKENPPSKKILKTKPVEMKCQECEFRCNSNGDLNDHKRSMHKKMENNTGIQKVSFANISIRKEDSGQNSAHRNKKSDSVKEDKVSLLPEKFKENNTGIQKVSFADISIRKEESGLNSIPRNKKSNSVKEDKVSILPEKIKETSSDNLETMFDFEDETHSEEETKENGQTPSSISLAISSKPFLVTSVMKNLLLHIILVIM